ncbi:hypothetical protein GCM10010261_46440 [Streptomyces pilosus]|nr:hypothetical protein GCM10010261_46440 [Streptomyces pilosus]
MSGGVVRAGRHAVRPAARRVAGGCCRHEVPLDLNASRSTLPTDRSVRAIPWWDGCREVSTVVDNLRVPPVDDGARGPAGAAAARQEDEGDCARVLRAEYRSVRRGGATARAGDRGRASRPRRWQ